MGSEMNQPHPTVSVIIPVYNVELYLRECLDSVVNQTLRDIEIICIDDGSADASPEILQEYREKDTRVLVVRQENRGLSAARNRGMDLAAGKYLYFIDSDDYMAPETLEVTSRLADEKDLDIVTFGFEQFSESEELLLAHPLSSKSIDDGSKVCSGVEYLRTAKDQRAYTAVVWRRLWRRDFLQEAGIRFIEGIIHEDNPFCFAAFMEARRVLAIPDKFYRYRRRSDSLSIRLLCHENVVGYFRGALEILAYALCDSYEPDKEHEIWRSYTELIRWAKARYEKLSEEQKELISFPREIEQALFIQLFKNSRAEDLQKELDRQKREAAASMEEAAKLRQEAEQLRSEIVRLQNELEKQQ